MANPTVVVEFLANTAKLVEGVKSVGSAADDAGKATKKISGKALVAWGAAGVALGAAAKFVKGAADETETLAKQTLALSRVTGMDTQTASEWVSVLKSRNIETSTFNRSMTILSKQMVAASDGSKKSVAAFQDLGVSMKDVRSGDTQAVLMQVADGLSRIENPAKRAALTQQLFGRSAQALTPLLYAGSDAIQEQLDMAERYGATVGDSTVGSVKELAAQQREMALAFEGVKIQLGTALIPLLASLAGILASVVAVMQPLIANQTAMKIVLGVLVTAMIAYKAATIAAAVATTVFEVAAAPVALTVIAIVAAIAALIAIGVLLYQNWDTIAAVAGRVWGEIQAGAQAVIGWLSANWPLILAILGGPIVAAVVLIVQQWKAITTETSNAWNTIRNTVTSILSAISNAIAAGFSAISSVVASATNAIRSAVTVAFEAIRSLVASAMNATEAAMRAAWNAMQAIVTSVTSAIRSTVSSLASWFSTPVATIRSALNTLANLFDGPLNAAQAMVAGIKRAVDSLAGIVRAAAGAVGAAADAIASAIKRPINAVLSAWNSLSFTVPSVTIPGFPGITIKGKTIVPGWGGTTIGGGSWGFPNVPLLARGGVFDQPTLAVVGEGSGREIVAPESLLRAILSEVSPSVRVFIGETELRGIVRTEVRQSENRTAASLLGGMA